jgi:uncharacterized protein YfaA (DUF2138 family)
MDLFIDSVKKDLLFYYEKHKQWLFLRDSIIKECYEKNIDWNKVKEETYETLLPRVFEELAIRVFYKNPKKKELVRLCFEYWCSCIYKYIY